MLIIEVYYPSVASKLPVIERMHMYNKYTH